MVKKNSIGTSGLYVFPQEEVFNIFFPVTGNIYKRPVINTPALVVL